MRNTLMFWKLLLVITALTAPTLVDSNKLPEPSDEPSKLPSDEPLIQTSDDLPKQVSDEPLNQSTDIPAKQSIDKISENANKLLLEQGLDAAGSSIKNTDFLRASEKEGTFDDRKSVLKRRGCSPTISCTLAGGHCVTCSDDCNGTIDRMGCSGGQNCKCCIPDEPSSASPTCPTVTCAPCSTTEGPTVNPNLNWLTTDSDRFVRFPQAMNWHDARALCRQNGLDLYHPKNITAVAIYLEDNFSDSWYWLGAKGNGTHQVWFSGEVLTMADPWYGRYYNNVLTTHCLAFITNYGQPRRNTVLFGDRCTGSNIDVLCG